MNNKKIEFLQEINNGKIIGAQKILADKLGIAKSAVNGWFKYDKHPSLDSIIKMAKIFKKTEKDIREIFAENTDSTEEIKNLKNSICLKDKEIEFLKEKNKFLEDKIKFLENKLNEKNS